MLKQALSVVLAGVAACVAVPVLAQIQIRPLPEQKAAVAVPLGGHVLAKADLDTWLDELIASDPGRAHTDGGVIVVVRHGEVISARGFGLADPSRKTPVDPAITMFRAGTTSTAFTATAVMQLVSDGRLDLDADINGYLDFSIPAFDGKPVTLRQLLTQTSGFDAVSKDVVRTAADASTNDPAWLGQWVKASLPERVYPPGEVAAQSDYGVALAGYIVERVSGQAFAAYMDTHIFRPLGMQHASFLQPLPPALAPHVAGTSFEVRSAVPASGLSISGEDMGRFVLAHMDGSQGLLRPGTAQAMREFASVSVPGLSPMALGLQRMDRNGQVIVGQRSDMAGAQSELAWFPAEDTGLFIAVSGRASCCLRQRLLDGFADRYFPPLPQQKAPTLGTAVPHGRLLEGFWVSSRQPRASWLAARSQYPANRIDLAADGTLITPMFPDAAGKPRHWREVRPFVWLDDATGSHLAASVVDGKVRWLSIDELAPGEVFLPATSGAKSVAMLIALGAIMASFLVALVFWPITAARRRRQADGGVTVASRWYTATRVVALLFLLAAAGWALLMWQPTGHADGWIRAVQVLTLLAVIGSLAAALHAWQAWRMPGQFTGKVGSVLLLLACVAASCFAVGWHLLAWRLNY